MSLPPQVVPAELLDHVRAETERAPRLTREQLDSLAVVLRPAIAEHCAASRVPPPRNARRRTA